VRKSRGKKTGNWTRPPERNMGRGYIQVNYGGFVGGGKRDKLRQVEGRLVTPTTLKKKPNDGVQRNKEEAVR